MKDQWLTSVDIEDMVAEGYEVLCLQGLTPNGYVLSCTRDLHPNNTQSQVKADYGAIQKQSLFDWLWSNTALAICLRRRSCVDHRVRQVFLQAGRSRTPDTKFKLPPLLLCPNSWSKDGKSLHFFLHALPSVNVSAAGKKWNKSKTFEKRAKEWIDHMFDNQWTQDAARQSLQLLKAATLPGPDPSLNAMQLAVIKRQLFSRGIFRCKLS
eukprot:g29322.t1